MKPTIKDVAREANVSISTVSYAVNNSDRISEKTRQHVLGVARRLNYSANSNAKQLRQRNNGAIGIFFNSWFGPIYSEIVKGVEKKVQEMGYDLIACSAFGGAESTAHRYLKDKMVDGAIILSNALSDELIRSAADKKLPLILLDREINAPHIYNILIDNFGGAFSATKTLIKSGCHEVYYFSGPENSFDNQKRLDGYVAALGFYNLPFTQNLIVRSDFTEKGGYREMVKLIKQGVRPKAIFAGNDEMAIGILRAAREYHISVPSELKIIGFDNIREAEITVPPLTSVSHLKFNKGEQAATILFDAIQGKRDIETITMLPTTLVERSTM